MKEKTQKIYNDISNWWNNHHDLGGKVYVSEFEWNYNPHASMYKYTSKLFYNFLKISKDEVEEFQNSDHFKNTTPNSDILNEASKIWYLIKQIKEGPGLMYTCQVQHEPWNSWIQYRFHPGSGRVPAIWLSEEPSLKAIYQHFDEPGFEPYHNSRLINSPMELMHEAINVDPETSGCDITTLEAFPKNREDTPDPEWHYWKINHSDKPWKFMRWSEGVNWPNHRTSWRSLAVELWNEMQNPNHEIRKRLNI